MRAWPIPMVTTMLMEPPVVTIRTDVSAVISETFGWHYLSNATCLMRPHLFYAGFVVSRITILYFATVFDTFEENLR